MSDAPFANSSVTGNTDKILKEVIHNTGSNNVYKDKDLENKMKKFENAKSISSDMFNESIKKDVENLNIKKFNGANAISSAQVFGYEEEEPTSNSIFIICFKKSIIIIFFTAGENLKELFSKVGGKLKQKAGNLITKFKNDWETN